MRFSQLDQITELVPGERITAIKRLSAQEQYLEDHFPRFPVMPGVLMLEAMSQAAVWLIRQSEGFAHAAVLLKEARNVKYSGFVTPGQTLVVTAELVKQEPRLVTVKAQAAVDGQVAVNARLVLELFNLADRHPSRRDTDPYLRHETRQQLTRLLSAECTATCP
ncbi:MAG TPA: 3-hydroxyacyl-ACP dehydratase FabZ family protein [Pirellulaceae bacterium]|nr:3-hydroxyacyl-ACP dehydratase FabZ family protein [Pirellulaceae bacterium]